MNNKSLFSLLMNDDNVNLYTKFFIVLYNIKKYGKENYIPNQLFMNKFKISKRIATRIINKMKNERIIRVYYINNKRYFDFIDKELEELKNNEIKSNYTHNDILDYNWLEED